MHKRIDPTSFGRGQAIERFVCFNWHWLRNKTWLTNEGSKWAMPSPSIRAIIMIIMFIMIIMMIIVMIIMTIVIFMIIMIIIITGPASGRAFNSKCR